MSININHSSLKRIEPFWRFIQASRIGEMYLLVTLLFSWLAGLLGSTIFTNFSGGLYTKNKETYTRSANQWESWADWS